MWKGSTRSFQVFPSTIANAPCLPNCLRYAIRSTGLFSFRKAADSPDAYFPFPIGLSYLRDCRWRNISQQAISTANKGVLSLRKGTDNVA